jgi:hypothetical protein
MLSKPLSTDRETSSTRMQCAFRDSASYAEQLQISPEDEIEYDITREGDEAFALSKALLSQ